MGILMAPRLSAINKFYSYFHMVDEGKEFDKSEFQSDIVFAIMVMVCAIGGGYMVVGPLMKKWVECLSGKGYGPLLDDDKSFESEENEEVR